MAMPPPVDLDLALLRTFIAIAEEMSFTRAAERVGRTQSAVSLQMQRLEGLVGHSLFARGRGGSVTLEPQAQNLLGQARELIALNDEVVASLRNLPAQGTLRLGIPDELSQRFLSLILQRFVDDVPEVQVEVVSALSCKLAHLLKLGELDVAIIERGLEPRQWPAEELLHAPLRWITSAIHLQHLQETVPVVASAIACEWRPPWLTDCLWSGMSLRALEASGRKYQIAARSITTSGQLAMVMAGKAVMVSMDSLSLPNDLRIVADGEGLPPLPEAAFLLLASRKSHPASEALSGHIRKVMAEAQT